MDQVQVDIVKAELLERGLDAGLDGAIGTRDGTAFCYDVELVSGDASLLDGLAEFLLVAVAVGAVEVVVALWERSVAAVCLNS